MEPWAIDVEIPVKSVGVFKGNSNTAGAFEIVYHDDQIEIYGWSGSSLIAEVDGEEIWRIEDIRVPTLSNGMSPRMFIDLFFHSHKK